MPTIWNINRYIETGWYVSRRFYKKANLQLEELGRELNFIGVVAFQMCHVSELFYRKANLSYPMKLKYEICVRDDRSVSMFSRLTDTKDGTVLVDEERITMYMDRSTRQRVELPNKYKEIYGSGKGKRMVPQVPQRPSSYFTIKLIVTHSDTDAQYHTNQSVYLKYCSDCAAAATAAHYYTMIHGDFFSYEILDTASAYKAETFPGDELHVSTWQNPQNYSELYFYIENGTIPVFTSVFNIRTKQCRSNL